MRGLGLERALFSDKRVQPHFSVFTDDIVLAVRSDESVRPD